MEDWEKTGLKPEQIKNIVCKYFDSLPDDHVMHNVPYIFIHLGNSYEVAKVQAKASYEAGEAEGIKTVVDWVKSHSEIEKCDPGASSYFEDYRWIDETEWQSFLKEHGMEG